MSARKLCNEFDFQGIKPLDHWHDRFHVTKWAEAYKKPTLRKRIDSLISKVRHELRTIN